MMMAYCVGWQEIGNACNPVAAGYGAGLMLIGIFGLDRFLGLYGLEDSLLVRGVAKPRPPRSLGEGPPPNDGFLLEPKSMTLLKGLRIDRYGKPSGSYASIEGVPFEARSLPRQKPAYGYHVYEVIEPF
jgi:hypothetical protein